MVQNISGYDKIRNVFAEVGRIFMPFFVAGDPDPDTFLKIIEAVEKHADFLEFGIPFSDPVADGPTVRKGDERAAASGVDPSYARELIAEVRKMTRKPIILLTYANLIGAPFDKARERISELADIGIDGLIIADVPFEESGPFRKFAGEVGIGYIPLVTPATDRNRMKKIASVKNAFIYLVSVYGTTGVRKHINGSLPKLLEDVKEVFGLPAAVGFGIGNPRTAAGVIKMGADGVIVGSALIRVIEKLAEKDREAIPSELEELTAEFAEAVHNPDKFTEEENKE